MNAKWMGLLFRALLVALLATGLMACGDLDVEENQENQLNGEEQSIEVEGTWLNQFGSEEVIDDERWDYMAIIEFDNEERWAITQNPDDDEWNPSAFNKLFWQPIEGDVFYYCVGEFGLQSEDEARDIERDAVDDDDLEEGCGGFAWTEMTRQ